MYFKTIIGVVTLLFVVKEMSSTTIEEEEQCLNFLDAKTPSQFKPRNRDELFKIAIDEIKILKARDEINYPGTQTPIFALEAKKKKNLRDTMNLIFLFRNSADSTQNKDGNLKHFFLALQYHRHSKTSQYCRVGIFRKNITLALTDLQRYCSGTYYFSFKENWQWTAAAECLRDLQIETLVREWMVDTEQGWKISVTQSTQGFRFDAVVTPKGQQPQVKYAGNWCISLAKVDQEVEDCLSNTKSPFKFGVWKALSELQNCKIQEFEALLDKIPKSTLDQKNILMKSSCTLQKVIYHDDGCFAVFFDKYNESATKLVLLVAARRGNCINGESLVPTHVTELLENHVETEIEQLLTLSLPFLSEVLDSKFTIKFRSLKDEIFERGAGTGAEILQLVSFVDMYRSGLYAIYARMDTNKNLEGYFFVANHYNLCGEICVEFVQTELSKSENDVCEEIKKYSKNRVPILPFRTWSTKAEIVHFKNIKNSFAKIEYKVKQFIETLTVIEDLRLINAAEVDYKGNQGIIGIYMFTSKGDPSSMLSPLSKQRLFQPIGIKPRYSIPLHSQMEKDKDTNSSVVESLKVTTSIQTLFCGVAVEIDPFRKRWLYRDTLTICENIDQVEHSVYYYLNGNFPFAPHWIPYDQLLEDENVTHIEANVNQIIHWNKKLHNLKENATHQECKVLFYKNYIVSVHLYVEKDFTGGYFSIASMRNKLAELVFLSPILPEKVLCYKMFQYMKQPFPYLEDWIPVVDTFLENSHLQQFRARRSTTIPFDSKTEGSNMASGKNPVDDILERLTEFEFIAVKTVSCRNGIPRIGILERTTIGKVSEQILLAWQESDTGFEIFYCSKTPEDNIDEFISNFALYSWKRMGGQADLYETLSATVECMIKWSQGNAVTELVEVFELSKFEVFAIYQINKSDAFFGILASKVCLDNSKVPSPSPSSETQTSQEVLDTSNSPTNSKPSNSPNSEIPNSKQVSNIFPKNSESLGSQKNLDSPNSVRNSNLNSLGNDETSISPRDSPRQGTTSKVRVTFFTDKKWTITFVTPYSESSNQKVAGKALMHYYKNPPIGSFGKWIDYENFNKESVSPMIEHMEPVLRNYFFGHNINFMNCQESEPCLCTPFKVRFQPQIDHLILIYVLINPLKKENKSYFYVTIVTKKCNYRPIGINEYRINYISDAKDDIEVVKEDACKYVAYGLAFNLRWTIFLNAGSERIQSLPPFEADIRSTVFKVLKNGGMRNIALSETRTYAGEDSSQFYIYQDLSYEDRFASAVIEENNPAGHICVSQLRTRVQLEPEILNYRNNRNSWTFARIDQDIHVLPK